MTVGSPFLSLPPELRLQIYDYLFDPQNNACIKNNIEKAYDFSACSLFRVNRLINDESKTSFRKLNQFIRVKTPFPQTLDNLISRKQVPVAFKDERSRRFPGCSLTVKVSAPSRPPNLDDESCQFVIHARDVEVFCEQWQWAQLSYGMNEHLTLELELAAPYVPDYEEKKLTKKLQQELLVPFGLVKDLQSTMLSGGIRVYTAVEQEMRMKQSIPYRSPETSLRDSARLHADGLKAIKAKEYDVALKAFFDSFRAIHILVNDDERQFLADAYYQGVIMTDAPYAGKHAQEERMWMRIRLVAAICEALALKEDYQRCKYWGYRSIHMIRDGNRLDQINISRPEQEAINEMPEPLSMANMYRYTARAQARLGDTLDAAWLYRVAKAYAPRLSKEIDEEVSNLSA